MPRRGRRRIKRHPRTWHGLLKGRSTFDSDVNKLMGQLFEDGHSVTTKLVCDEIRLDYNLVKERSKVINAIAKERKRLKSAWKVFETDPSYMKRYKEYSKDFIAFDLWKKENKGLYERLLNDFGLTEDQIHDIWVNERMFEAFIENGMDNNFYFFVTEYSPKAKSWVYSTPDYWKYTQYNLKLARRFTKSIKTLLIRHQTMHMMLTSGESVDVAYQLQEDVEKMLINGRPNRFRCEICMEHGILREFREQPQLVEHYNKTHIGLPEKIDKKDDEDIACPICSGGTLKVQRDGSYKCPKCSMIFDAENIKDYL